MYPFNKILIERLSQIVFGWLILVVLYQFSNSLLISQLESPVLIRVDLDPIYWLLHLSGLANFLTSNYLVAVLFDSLLFISLIAVVLIPQNQWLKIIASVLFTTYVIMLNSYMCWHYHNLVPLVMLLIPFCVRSIQNFGIWFAGIRYAVLFIYGSAALWKLYRGSVFNPGQMNWMIEYNYMDRMVQEGYALSFWENGIINLMNYPAIADAILIIGIGMEACFLIGFFTKRFDFVLLILGVVFHIGTTALVEVSFIQLWILFIVFIPNIPFDLFGKIANGKQV